jgi:hypothetical protein
VTAEQEARLDTAVAEAVALFPPLSEETKDQIAHLLRPHGGDAA